MYKRIIATDATIDEIAQRYRLVRGFVSLIGQTKIKDPTSLGVLMILRHDGFIGFPGGKMEPNDQSVSKGALRELQEELGYEAIDGICRFLKLLTAYENTETPGGELIVHFVLDWILLYSELRDIAQDAFLEGQFGHEIQGIMLVPFSTSKDFCNNSFKSTAKLEFEELKRYVEQQNITITADNFTERGQ